MKKLGKIKLNQLSKTEMEKRELNHIHGGNLCGCACLYAGEQCAEGDDYWGGVSKSENSVTNADYGYHSPNP